MHIMLSSVFLVFQFIRLGSDFLSALSLFSSPFFDVFESSVFPRIHHSAVTLSIGTRRLWSRAPVIAGMVTITYIDLEPSGLLVEGRRTAHKSQTHERCFSHVHMSLSMYPIFSLSD